jgi:hypothetical protein
VKPIEIVVTPVNGDTRYEARVGEEFLGSFREPFLEVARVLRRRGVPDEMPIAMRREGSPWPSLTSTVGQAAKLAIEEGNTTPPRSRAFRSFQGLGSDEE